jgi:hypothetical protein
MARENRTWGYDRIVGAALQSGPSDLRPNFGNIFASIPDRTSAGAESHDHLEGVHPVAHGLHSVLHRDRQSTGVAGRHHPTPGSCWMEQVARNATMEGHRIPEPLSVSTAYRDTKFCREFRETLVAGGVKCLALPARSPNLNSYAGALGTFGKRGVPV